jgi:hypothetical protein
MAMPAPSSPPQPYAPKRGHGCLWGCLIAMLLVALPFILAGGYGAWFLWEGYKRDPVLRVVGEMVREDGMARQALGDNVTITGVESNYFSGMPGETSNAYEVTLEGSKGQGRLSVTAHDGRGKPVLDSAILTGPDGRRYDLLKRRMLPRETTIDNSI